MPIDHGLCSCAATWSRQVFSGAMTALLGRPILVNWAVPKVGLQAPIRSMVRGLGLAVWSVGRVAASRGGDAGAL